jgi:hypothetical protein
MAKLLLKILLILTALTILFQCAQIVPLNGGKQDVTAPKLIEALPPNKTNNFGSGLIILLFDEYIKLNDLNNQMVVSPRLKTQPIVEADGKKITITLKQNELLPNTTYRIYLGQAILDMNEGNALKNFEYIFSTGSYIDSLTLKGIVADAVTDKPAGNSIVGLYDDLTKSDSLPLKSIPDYLAKCDDNGSFSFSNLPHRTFKAYAFFDKNKNYMYDRESEKIAFLNAPFKIDSNSVINFTLFHEESSKGFIKRKVLPYYGFLQLILNKKSLVSIEPLNPRDKENLIETAVNKEKDTVSIYYKNVTDSLNVIFKNITQEKVDTLKLALPRQSPAPKKFKTLGLNANGGALSLGAKPILEFLNWMDILNSDRLRIKLKSKEDSLIESKPVQGHWLDITHFEIDNELKEGASYELKIDTNAFFTINGISNDSISLNFKTQSKVQFGKAIIKLLLYKKQHYIIQLINDRDQVIREDFINIPLSASNSVYIDFIDVQPGSYLIKVIFDNNGNKKWDTGDLLLKRQPERVIVCSKQIKILSDWEIEEEIIIKE